MHEGFGWWTASQDGLSEANTSVSVIKYCVVVGEEVEAEDPLFSARRVHKFDYAHIIFPLEPLISIDPVWYPVDEEFKVWNFLILFFVGAITDGERGRRLVAFECSIDQSVVNPPEVFVGHHVERSATINHSLISGRSHSPPTHSDVVEFNLPEVWS